MKDSKRIEETRRKSKSMIKKYEKLDYKFGEDLFDFICDGLEKTMGDLSVSELVVAITECKNHKGSY